jgi:thiol-disulfide isomerase/thioredoxin
MKVTKSHLINSLGVVACVVGMSAASSAARSLKEIATDLGQVSGQLARYGGVDNLINPQYHQQMQQQAVPLLKKEVELLHELATAEPKEKDAANFKAAADLALCAAIGDADAAKTLEHDAGAGDPASAPTAKLALDMRDWWADATAEEQQKVLARLTAEAKSRPTDDALARTLVLLADHGAASTALAHGAGEVVVEQMKGKFADQYRLIPNKPGFPLAVAGNVVDGHSFSTSQWKGKVVMVDFWATWCPPCREELPQVVETYNKYHDQGFEIIGVSNDTQKPALVKFLKEHPEVKWPQLFGPSNSPSQWNALSERFKVNAIPTVYLIDRNGILRSTVARGHLDQLIPMLLQEKPDSSVATAGKPAASEAPATSAKPDPEPTAASASTPAKPAATADDDAEKAAHALSLARSYVAVRKYEAARPRLQKIIDTYPATPAARQAAELLKQIEGD